LITAILGLLVQEDLVNHEFLRERTSGADHILPRLAKVDVASYCRKARVPEDLVRKAARRLASASSVAFYEDLGIQMNRHSTLVSYLNRLLWGLTGSFAKKGSMNAPMPFTPLTGGRNTRAASRTSPVVGARIISGLIPCNVIPDEILTDHPARYRAMIVESANPAHSLADSPRMREALRALELVVVIDVAMTETARLAHYVLPVPTQFEKYEATFFNFEFPRNVFHLRRPLLDPPAGLLTEPEIHARLCEALGAVPEGTIQALRAALEKGRGEFAGRFLELVAADPALFRVAPVILLRTLGPTLANGAASASVLWAAAQLLAINAPDSLRRAGFKGEGAELGDALFDAVLSSPSGLVFAVDDYQETWRRVRAPDGKFNLSIPELFPELDGLATEDPGRPDERFPFVLSAGERRSFTANTIYRDPDWRKKDRDGALRVSPSDAERLGLTDGGQARLTTKRGSALVRVEISDRMQPGHVSLPNGLGIVNAAFDSTPGESVGVAPNELTAGGDRDWLAGTPWHKFTPARIEAIPA
jgi:formate dehydrogenase